MRGREKQQRGCLSLARATPMPRESESQKQATLVELFGLFYVIYQLGQKGTKQVDKDVTRVTGLKRIKEDRQEGNCNN